jgi:hypothetical protein
MATPEELILMVLCHPEVLSDEIKEAWREQDDFQFFASYQEHGIPVFLWVEEVWDDAYLLVVKT